MPYYPWDRNVRPCQTCKGIYDDEKGRLKEQLIPCLQAHKKAATMGKTALVTYNIRNIGWPCPFAQTAGDLAAFVFQKGAVEADAYATRVLSVLSEDAKSVARKSPFDRDYLNSPMPDVGLYDDHPIMRPANGPRPKMGEFVILKGEPNSQLWQQFKPWYMLSVSASLEGWNVSDRVARVWQNSIPEDELKKALAGLSTRENATKVVMFMAVVVALSASVVGRVISAAAGGILTVVAVNDLVGPLVEACRLTFAGDTEADLDKASAALRTFWAKLIVFLGITLAAVVVARLLGAVMSRAALKSPEEIAGVEKSLVEMSTPELEAIHAQNAAKLAGVAPAAGQAKPIVGPGVLQVPKEAAKRASRVTGVAFADLPDVTKWAPGRIQHWLSDNGFFLIKKATTKTVNGVTKTSSSEIWYRCRQETQQNGKIEAVRIDALGEHVAQSNAGASPHMHRDLINWSDWKTYLNMSVPSLPVQHSTTGAVVTKFSKNSDWAGTANSQGKVDATNPNFYRDSHPAIGRNTPKHRK